MFNSAQRSLAVAATAAVALTACSPPVGPPAPTTTTTTTVPASCVAPTAPVLSTIDDSESISFATSDGSDIEVATVVMDETPATAAYELSDSFSFDGLSGSTRVVARSAADGCENGPFFDATFNVADTYEPRSGTAGNTAVSSSDPSIVGWATGHTTYTPGANVDAQWQVPTNAYGVPGITVVVLGDGGEITLTFDAPITNDAGPDLAVYENGFAVGALDFLELGFVEVSSNGSDFVRFDSASRRTTPVGGFEGQLASELGGVAGRDLNTYGTPFDLTALANQPLVRNGAVDLDAITHVRIVDITGDGSVTDSFGRPIYDAYPGSGSAGFDLGGVAVLSTTP